MKIAIGSDHAGFSMKEELIPLLQQWGYEVKDFGTYSPQSIDYPDVAKPVCEAVRMGYFERGILICGTGIGMSIAANKCKGIRCALCSEGYSARLTRLHNDSNVLALGARVTGIELAIDIAKTWLGTEFPNEERNARRISKLALIEDERI